MKIIEASGSPFEIGKHLGSELKELVRTHAENSEEFVEIEKRWSGSAYIRKMMEAATAFSSSYMEEIRGLAEGLSIDFERVFLWNCRGDLRWPDDISPSLAYSLSEGCTSVMMRKGDNNATLIAHNEDGSEEFAGICPWIRVKPDDAPGFESFMYPGLVAGHSMGANAAGIVQTINNIRVADLKPGVPRHIITRAVLDAENLDQVFDIVKRADRASGFHHNIGCAKTGRLFSIEAPASGCSIEEITNTSYVHANHLIHESEKQKEQDITSSSTNRQIRAEELNNAGVLRDGDPTNILFDELEGREILRTPKENGDDYGQTLATGIFEMHPDRIEISLIDGAKRQELLNRTITLIT
ncbi:peptidase C45 [Sneathiella sp. P13V-1]|uniref:C45 family autoproteolytic acyltransferase/hydolase n=1 Tax=Sneathiella sp. P13V-1 TaxID=2697366 RepID=UPI00187B240D|nr:C45 family peptidase [Sneathiella sp. P13V-1]MBE7637535.1 peptidase C45 [Sneathiella sp. P13V-1]